MARRGEGLAASATATGRAVVRGWGMATARWRPLPDFLLIGSKRGGSTSLYYSLLQNPRIVPLYPSGRTPLKRNHTKGVHFFDSEYARGPRWYRSHFPTSATRTLSARGGSTVVGEASPYYLHHPLAAERAAALVPEARLVVTLRDPVERTFSHWREQRRNGVELLDFEAALAAEDERTAGEEQRLSADDGAHGAAHENQSYRGQSEYARGLRRWLSHYPRRKLLVVASEDFYRGPQDVLDRVADFLEVPHAELTSRRVWNPAPPSAIPGHARSALEEHFRPHVHELEELIGERLPWDRLH